MSVKQDNYISKLFFSVLPYALVFILGVLYLYFLSAYLFFYQEEKSLFLLSSSFLSKHINQPGGFLAYLEAFKTALYFYPLLGAILVSLEIVGIIYLIDKIAMRMLKRRSWLLSFCIGAVLFYFQLQLEYPAVNNLGLLIQLFLFYGSLTYFKGKRGWIPVVLFPLVYFLFGGFSVVLLIMYSIYVMQNKEWFKLVAMWMLGIIFFFIGKEWLFYQTIETLLSFPFSADKIGKQTGPFLLVVFLIAFLPILFQLSSKLHFKENKLVGFVPFLIIGVLIVLSIQKIDKKNTRFFRTEKLFYAQKYDELIAYNSGLPAENMLTTFLVNIALAETGQLSESFFRFRQSPDGMTLCLPWDISGAILRKGAYFYYTLGMINEAQHWAYEYMIHKGNCPESMKMLIKTELIKGNYKVAEKYISILEKSIFYRKEAKSYRTLLYNDEAIVAHPELGKKKLLDTKQDFFVRAENPPANLDPIIEADSTNIIAIEYKLAWLMLQKNFEGVVALLPLMEKAGYTRIPKNVEEVVVTYKLLNMGDLPELERLKINQHTVERFQQFSMILEQFRGNKQQAQATLAKSFADTYWYYVFYLS